MNVASRELKVRIHCAWGKKELERIDRIGFLSFLLLLLL